MNDSPEDREKWDKLWRDRVNRRLTTTPLIEIEEKLLLHFGAIANCTIAEDPPEYADQIYRPNGACPVCGTSTFENERCAASISLTFENGPSLGMGVWVHPTCLLNCPVTDEPAPIPW